MKKPTSAELILKNLSVAGLKFDTTSPFFREALRNNNEAALEALEIAIETGFDEVFGDTIGEALAAEGSPLMATIVEVFTDYVKQKDVITMDAHLMAEATEATCDDQEKEMSA